MLNECEIEPDANPKVAIEQDTVVKVNVAAFAIRDTRWMEKPLVAKLD